MAVEAEIDVFVGDDGSYIMKFADFGLVDWDKNDGYMIRLIDDENLEFTEPNGCQQD